MLIVDFIVLSLGVIKLNYLIECLLDLTIVLYKTSILMGQAKTLHMPVDTYSDVGFPQFPSSYGVSKSASSVHRYVHNVQTTVIYSFLLIS